MVNVLIINKGVFLYCRISFILPMISTKNDSAVAIKISPKKISLLLLIFLNLIMEKNKCLTLIKIFEF